ncbi:MAG: response regulator [Dehalococcoidia bacterium]
MRVFLVDDHHVVCEGLRRMLEQEEDLRVVGEAQSGEEALAKLQGTPADAVLLDVRLGGMDGIETLRKLKVSHPDLKVLMLTSYGDEYLGPSIDAGATGYLLKRANRGEMVKAIREAVQGGAPLDAQVTPGRLNRLRNPALAPDIPLSARETQVLELAAAGMGNKEIANRLGVTQTTIKNHMTSILRKLDANDRTHAVTIALRKGWISNPVEPLV